MDADLADSEVQILELLGPFSEAGTEHFPKWQLHVLSPSSTDLFNLFLWGEKTTFVCTTTASRSDTCVQKCVVCTIILAAKEGFFQLLLPPQSLLHSSLSFPNVSLLKGTSISCPSSHLYFHQN